MATTLNRGGLAAPSYNAAMRPPATRPVLPPARAGTRGFPSSHPGGGGGGGGMGGFGGGGGGGLLGGDGRPMMPGQQQQPGGAGAQGPNPSWDPENLLGAPTRGLITKSLVKQRAAKDKEFAKAVERVSSDEQKAAMLRRASREPPAAGDAPALVEFFLDTVAEDMEYEVARCRPLCTPGFFRELDAMLGQARFGGGGGGGGGALLDASSAADLAAAAAAPGFGEPDADRVAELETLRTYLEAAVEAVDAAVRATATAADRMRALLEAKDKRAAILALAEANQIDRALVDLLQTSADAAREAGQEGAAAFMEKVRGAVGKYLIAGAPAGMMPAVPAALQQPATGRDGAQAAPGGSGLLIAGGAGGGGGGGDSSSAAGQQQQQQQQAPSGGGGGGLIL